MKHFFAAKIIFVVFFFCLVSEHSFAETFGTSSDSVGAQPDVDAASVKRTLDQLISSLNSIQKLTGEWVSPLEADPSVDVMPLLLAAKLGLRFGPLEEQTTKRIFSRQDPTSGTWSAYPGGPPNLDVTGMILHGLKFLGQGIQENDVRIERTWNWYRKAGGDQKLNVLNKMILAFGGVLPPTILPNLSPKIDSLPSWSPLNVFNVGFGRTGLLPLTVWNFYRDAVHDKKVVAKVSAEHLQSAGKFFRHPFFAPWAWPEAFDDDDLVGMKFTFKILSILQKIIPTSEEFWAQESIGWILAHQHEDGTWAGAIQITYFCMIALAEAQSAGAGDFSKPINKAWNGLMNWRVPIPDGVTIQLSTIGPVMDTARTLSALPSESQFLNSQGKRHALSWLLSEQTQRIGDWAIKAPHTPAGGWAFEYFNDWYPDVDDTAMAVEAISRVHTNEPELAKKSKVAVNKAIHWMTALQNRDGGFPTWDKDNSKLMTFAAKNGIGGLPEVADDSQDDITSRSLKAFASLKKYAPDYLDDELTSLIDSSIERACKYQMRVRKNIAAANTPVWRGKWMVNYLYGTSEAVDSMLKVGCKTVPEVESYVKWLLSKQNDDGGFGESPESYMVSDFVPSASTLTQTEFVLAALIEYEKQNISTGSKSTSANLAIARGIHWLLGKTKDNPTPSEPEFTGVFVRKVWYARYWMLPHYEAIRIYRDWLELSALTH